MIFPKNDEATQFFRENGYGNTYNDGLTKYLRETLQIEGKTLTDLLSAFDNEQFSPDLLVSPASLFTSPAGQGAWWDVQDLSTLFSDDAATIQAVVDGVVAVHQDKSGNDFHRTQTNNSLRPILRQRTDGVYYLDYSGGKILTALNTKAAFKCMHNGDGGTLLAFIEWPQGNTNSNYLQTSVSTTQVGFRTIKSSTTQSITYNIDRGVGGSAAAAVSNTRFAVSSAAHMFAAQYQNNGLSNDLTAWCDARITIDTSGTSNAPSAADSTNNLANASTFGGREYEVIIYPGILTDKEVYEIYLWMRARNDYTIENVDYTLLLGGQSNMSGRGDIATGSPLAEEVQDGVYSYTKAEEFRLAQIPEHSLVNRPTEAITSPDEGSPTTPEHGFALRAGKDINTNSGVSVLLVPCAIGGTGMSQWNTPSTLDDRTTLLGAMNYRYHRASTKGGSPVIIWYGHEADTGSAVPDYTNGGVGDTYKNNLRSLFETVRDNIVDAPIIFIQLASDDTLATAEAHAAAGEAMRQLELELDRAYMVVAHDVERNPSTDDIHVSRAGHDDIADRVALAFREHILGEAVNGTGPRYSSLSFIGDTVTVTFDKAIESSVGDYGDLFRIYVNGVEQTVTSAVRGTDTSTVVVTCSAFLTSPLVMSYGYAAGAASAARTDFVQDSDGLPAPNMGPILDPTELGSELFSSQAATSSNASGGATMSEDLANRSIEVTVVGTSKSYPRLRIDLGMEVGKTYRIYGTNVGDKTNLNTVIPVRAALTGTTAPLSYDETTGIFSGDVVAEDSNLEFLMDGTELGTCTITNLTCREVL